MAIAETIITISERTGYSPSTVSRVLSGKAKSYRISEEAEQKIKAEAQRCNYVPNPVAKSLRTRKSNSIGLVIPSLSNPFFGDIAAAVVGEAQIYGYSVVVIDSMENEEVEKTGATLLQSRMVDGIIAAPCCGEPSFFEELSTRIPVVLIDRYFSSSPLPYVTTDNYAGALQATKILLSAGHKRIACIQGLQSSLPNERRVLGYYDALQEVGLFDAAHVVGDSFSVENGYREALKLFSHKGGPTAIFALSNTIVLGVIRAAREKGVRIPQDLSVVSFDDSPYLDYLGTPITRIGQPLEEIGKKAVRMLLTRLQPELALEEIGQIQLAPTVIFGKSVAKL